MFKTTPLFEANYNAYKKESIKTIINQGGSSSGKTYAILQLLFLIASEESKQVITIVGQDIPNLRAGALRQALEIYTDNTALHQLIKSYNSSLLTFYFNNGSLIEFKSYDTEQDARSGKRQYLFINECNSISSLIFNQLKIRTDNKIFLDYNPSNEFWVHSQLIGKPGIELLISDHRMNPFVSQNIRDGLEELKEVDENLFRTYARGLTGKLEGQIFNFNTIAELPEDIEQAFISYALDFGYTNDPTACIAVYKLNGELYIDELVYQTGLTNEDIYKKLIGLGINIKNQIIADSAEPKSIEELKRLGLNLIPASKGADSILASIDILKRYKLNVTNRSVNLRKELQNYSWQIDKATGKSMNRPIDRYNHAIDALRYVALIKLKIHSERKKIRVSF